MLLSSEFLSPLDVLLIVYTPLDTSSYVMLPQNLSF